MQKASEASIDLTGGRLAYSVAEASRATGLGRTTLYALMANGDLPSRKIGKRRLIPAASLLQLVGCE